jgi:hypothetical protein
MHRGTIKFRLPLGHAGRDHVNAEIARLRESVIPLLEENAKRRPVVVGSAILLEYDGRKMLVTAEHVMADAKGTLFFFDNTQTSRPLGGTFGVDLAADLAVKDLEPEEVAALSHRPFLQGDDLGTMDEVGSRFYGTAVGFPSTRAKLLDRVTIDPRMLALSGIAKFADAEKIVLAFDKKQGVIEKDQHVTPPDPPGMSGGALFGLPLDGFAVRPDTRAKLLGVSTHWRQKRKLIEAADILTLRRLLNNRLTVDEI